MPLMKLTNQVRALGHMIFLHPLPWLVTLLASITDHKYEYLQVALVAEVFRCCLATKLTTTPPSTSGHPSHPKIWYRTIFIIIINCTVWQLKEKLKFVLNIEHQVNAYDIIYKITPSSPHCCSMCQVTWHKRVTSFSCQTVPLTNHVSQKN